jgi:hypothetical protein
MFKNKSLLINIILLAIIALLAVYVFVFNKNINFETKKPYYAVYLQTGDLYFGHLCKFFSKYTLTNVYLLQIDQKGGSNLQKFEQSAFQPEDKITLNKENIVWVSKIKNESPLIPILEGKQALTPTTVPSETSTTESIK